MKHDQTGAAEHVPERQADGGRGGDLSRREGDGAGVSERDPPLQRGERAASAAPQCDRPAAPAAAARLGEAPSVIVDPTHAESLTLGHLRLCSVRPL